MLNLHTRKVELKPKHSIIKKQHTLPSGRTLVVLIMTDADINRPVNPY